MVRWSKEHQAIAKRDKCQLLCLAIYGKHAKRGSITYEGPASTQDVKDIDELILKLVKRHNRTAKRRKS